MGLNIVDNALTIFIQRLQNVCFLFLSRFFYCLTFF